MSDVICFMEVFFKEMELMLYSRPNQIPTIVARINQREGLGSKGLTIACNNLVRALQKQFLLNENQTFWVCKLIMPAWTVSARLLAF